MKRKREYEKNLSSPEGSESEGDEDQIQEAGFGGQAFGSQDDGYPAWGSQSPYQSQPQSPYGSQGFASPPPWSPVTPDEMLTVQQMVSGESESFGAVLQRILGNIDPVLRGKGEVTINEVAMNAALRRTTGFEFVGISTATTTGTEDEEEVFGSPGASQEYITQASSQKGVDVVEEEDAYPEEAQRPEQEPGEEFDEDALYVGQMAEEIASEALDELLAEVIGEISSEHSYDPQVLRWLILDDAEFADLLDVARQAVVSDLKGTIPDLLRD